ncbi:MAG: type III-B CRISPR-associated protein Cas10/Cmr2 [Deltaproteobacteria bacterium]|nr:type III-B CRISPR-associated protein Cas10/Cmr2 [Deltaproteobacteria bacterium]
MNNQLLKLKIQALLHDPPEKAILLSRHKPHEERGKRLLEMLGLPAEIPELIKTADRLASACDRINFPKEKELTLDFLKEPIIIHPLSGKQFLIPQTLQMLDEKEVMKSVEAAIQEISKTYLGDQGKIYLSLWRELIELLQKEEFDVAKLGKLWELLPSDTRIPDHSIWEHRRVTSAIAGSLPDPGFLLFQIGPVQDSIATARKTQDLWAGSYLLSWLSWCGMKVVCEKFGPDAVIFPDLVKQPFLGLWLKEKGLQFISEPDPIKLSSSTLTNRFLAILPANQIKEVAEEAERTVKGELFAIAKWIREKLERNLVGKLNCTLSEWEPIWDRQIAHFLETYWIGWKWDTLGNGVGKAGLYAFVDLCRNLLNLGEDWVFDRFLRAYEKGFPPNLGTAYGNLYKITEKALGSRKTIRDFAQQSEPHFKCTLTGIHEPVHPKAFTDDKGVHDCDDFGGLNRFWQAVQLNSEGRIRIGERLGAIALVKRYASEYFNKEKKLGIELNFPSTSTVATSAFKLRVIENLSYVPLTVAVDGYSDAVLRLFSKKPEQAKSEPLPQVKRACESAGKNLPLAWKFSRLDGDWLFEESFDEKELKKDLNDDFNSDYLTSAVKYLKELKKVISEFDRGRKADIQIGFPSRYYAVLAMDGDEMGKWLSGEKAPHLKDILHPTIWNNLEGQNDWIAIGEERRPLNPSLHLATSKALRDFSLFIARKVIEEEHLGKLIYSGGDDVLAFVSLRDLPEVMQKLRVFFSGNLKGNENKACWSDEATGFVRTEDGFALTMGTKASASMGVCIAHHTQNLGQVLDTARSNEKQAKNKLGRNAFSIALAKRSGGTEEFGTKWFYREPGIDTIQLLRDWVRLFSQDKGISAKFASDFHIESTALESLPIKAIQAELLRLAYRHRAKSLSKEETEKLKTDVEQQVQGLVKLKEAGKGLIEIGKFLSLSTFLARGENQ